MQLTENLNLRHTPLHPAQFGFRAHHLTESAINLLLEKNKQSLDKSACVGAVFDTIDHKVLLNKLSF